MSTLVRSLKSLFLDRYKRYESQITATWYTAVCHTPLLTQQQSESQRNRIGRRSFVLYSRSFFPNVFL